jgi:hypothetical protein
MSVETAVGSLGRRRLAAWLLSLPLMVVSSQCAHVLAYRLAYPNAHLRVSELLVTGHSYMVGYSGYLPMLLALIGAIELVALGWLALGTIRPSLRRPVPAWAFALLPMLAFTLQELLERLLQGGPFPWWVVLQPTFRFGLLLQIPFALIAYLAARLLLRAARGLRGAVEHPAPKPRRLEVRLSWIVPASEGSPSLATRCAHPGRGPPRVLPADGAC